MKNKTLSSGDCVMKCVILDTDDGELGWLLYTSAATSAEENVFPNGLSQDIYYSGPPVVLYEGQKIKLEWGADAAASGTAYYYLNILQFVGEKYV